MAEKSKPGLDGWAVNKHRPRLWQDTDYAIKKVAKSDLLIREESIFC